MKLKAIVDNWRISDEISAEIAQGLGWKIERAGELWRAWAPSVKRPDNTNWEQLWDFQNSLPLIAKAFDTLGMGPVSVFYRQGKYVCEFELAGAKFITPELVCPAWAASYAVLFAVRTNVISDLGA